MVFLAFLCLGLLVTQGSAALILCSRLVKGATRHPPLTPSATSTIALYSVSVVVPTLNEVERLTPCLEGLHRQGEGLREVLVVDSNSQDGTREKVLAMAARDARFELLTDEPLPPGWVGRPWALNYGFHHSHPESEWILGLDADTQPQSGLLEAIVEAAQKEKYDVLSLSPQFILRSPQEWWLQPALLMTLLYRFDSAGVRAQDPQRVMANGQCFLAKRWVLEQLGGYESARQSFCDDVTLARFAAQRGFRVGFLDGAKVLKVRMYEGIGELWQEWGRSLDLKDASTRAQLWADVIFLGLVQALPIPVLMVLGLCVSQGYNFPTLAAAIALNGGLVLMRWSLLLAISPSYDRESQEKFASLAFWLSPLADPWAVLRIYLSAQQTPQQWRGRHYP